MPHAEEVQDEQPFFTPRRIAIAYVLFGLLWIYASDVLLFVLAEGSQIRLQIEAAKGTAFILISAGFIYWLGERARRSQQVVETRIRQQTRELSIFHRIVRHNLRNIATVIGGRAEQAGAERRVDPHVGVIERKAERLKTLAEKASLIRGISEQESTPWVRQDIAKATMEICDQHQAAHPEATVTVEASGPIEVLAPSRLGFAVSELVENAIVHSDADPEVSVAVRSGDETVTITVADNGPGIPEVERTAIDGDIERVLDHSQGVGLWLARLIVENAGGSITATESPLKGAAVEITIPYRPPEEDPPTERPRAVVDD